MNLDATIAWNFPTIYALSQYLAQQLDSINSSKIPPNWQSAISHQLFNDT